VSGHDSDAFALPAPRDGMLTAVAEAITAAASRVLDEAAHRRGGDCRMVRVLI
jgi:hypothetical protein